MKSYPICHIRIAGLLDPSWSDWFEGLTIKHTVHDTTIMTGPLPDQAALHGVLNKIRDLGLTLLALSVEPAVSSDAEKV